MSKALKLAREQSEYKNSRRKKFEIIGGESNEV